MKIRHKGTVEKLGDKAAVYVVMEESANFYIAHWEQAGPTEPLLVLRKEFYEPIKTWKNITSECNQNGRVFFHYMGGQGYPIFDDEGYIRPEYRFKKVQLWSEESGCIPQLAFIIEQETNG